LELDLEIAKGELIENFQLSDPRPWADIWREDAHTHHLKLKCPECGRVHTCRCSAEKILVFTYCDSCRLRTNKSKRNFYDLLLKDLPRVRRRRKLEDGRIIVP
jgi:hypothetical protein